MKKDVFKVSLEAREALAKINGCLDVDDLIHQEYFDLGDGKYIGSSIFEKYYNRLGSRVALVVYVDNLKGYTEIRTIATSVTSWFIKTDWGTDNNLTNSVRKILGSYIVK